jgi:hypothetical protein
MLPQLDILYCCLFHTSPPHRQFTHDLTSTLVYDNEREPQRLVFTPYTARGTHLCSVFKPNKAPIEKLSLLYITFDSTTKTRPNKEKSHPLVPPKAVKTWEESGREMKKSPRKSHIVGTVW